MTCICIIGLTFISISQLSINNEAIHLSFSSLFSRSRFLSIPFSILFQFSSSSDPFMIAASFFSLPSDDEDDGDEDDDCTTCIQTSVIPFFLPPTLSNSPPDPCLQLSLSFPNGHHSKNEQLFYTSFCFNPFSFYTLQQKKDGGILLEPSHNQFFVQFLEHCSSRSLCHLLLSEEMYQQGKKGKERSIKVAK